MKSNCIPLTAFEISWYTAVIIVTSSTSSFICYIMHGHHNIQIVHSEFGSEHTQTRLSRPNIYEPISWFTLGINAI